MLVPVTALYAGILAIIAVVLGGTVGATRGKLKVPLGDGGHNSLVVANRRHMNFVENVPLVLILFGLMELNGTPKMWLHVLGIILVLARIIHPLGLSMENMSQPARVVGAAATVLVTLAAAATVIWEGIKHLMLPA